MASTGAVLDAVGRGRPVASFKKGGTAKKTGLYKLHKGERVTPKKSKRMSRKSERR